jgi:hypothetical protein
MALRGGSGARATIGAALAAAALLLFLAPAARAGSSALVARGSAEQVQVTGATSGAKVKLLQGGANVQHKHDGKRGCVD